MPIYLFRSVKLASIKKAVKKTQWMPLEGNPPIEDDPINVEDVKPLVVPEKVVEN